MISAHKRERSEFPQNPPKKDRHHEMKEILTCDIWTGEKNFWRFEKQEYVRESEDPYVAAIQVLYDIIRYLQEIN